MEKMLHKSSLKNKLILETYIGNYSYLIRKAKSIDPDALYVLSDLSYETIIREKSRLDNLNRPINVLNILCNHLELPLEKGSVDYIIDCFHNSCFGLSYDSFLFPLWKPYLHEHSRIIGIFLGLDPGCASRKKTMELYPNSCHDIHNFQAFKQTLVQHGFVVEETYTLDPLFSSSFQWHVPGEKLHFYCYSARLQRSS